MILLLLILLLLLLLLLLLFENCSSKNQENTFVTHTDQSDECFRLVAQLHSAVGI